MLEKLCYTPLRGAIALTAVALTANCSAYGSEQYSVNGEITHIGRENAVACFDFRSTDGLAAIPVFGGIPIGSVQQYCCPNPDQELSSAFRVGEKRSMARFKGDGSVATLKGTACYTK